MKTYKSLGIFILCILGLFHKVHAQQALTPPMGFMTWNYFQLDIDENKLKSLADAMVDKGLVKLGYDHIFIDDGWQGGRDNRNNMIPDPAKFPSGMKALADYLHKKGLKLGIYSDAAPLTCAGFTASLNFEEQDARTFAEWGIDYLKYDYCGAPVDQETAKKRYKRMGDALKNSGREIVFGLCEWGDRQSWTWGSSVGGSLWRTSADIRDKWKSLKSYNTPHELHSVGAGIMDILNINAPLDEFAGPNKWNDADMLVVGLYGKKGPSGDLGGTGCTDIEYQTQMSLWCMMAAPLMITCDVREMNAITESILTNKDIIKIDQDPLGKQAKRVVFNENWQVFVKPMSNNQKAIAILNSSDKEAEYVLETSVSGLSTGQKIREIWTNKVFSVKKKNSFKVKPHETLVFLTQ